MLSKAIRLTSSTLLRRIGVHKYSVAALSEEHAMLQKTCRDFADKELMHIAAGVDKNHSFPKDAVAKLGEMGKFSCLILS